MPTSETVSPQRPVREDPEVPLARGALRETLAALKNLSRLLTSIRVAPRALEPVIPAVEEALQPAEEALERILGAVASELDGDRSHAAAGIERYVAAELGELRKALRAAGAGAMNVKQRLELERTVIKVEANLDAATELLDLLTDAIWAPRSALTIHELLRESRAPPGARQAFPISVSGDLDEVELYVPGTVATRLLLLAINLAAPVNKDDGVWVKVAPSRVFCNIKLGPVARGTSRCRVAPVRLVVPTKPVVEAAAQRIGCGVQLPNGGGELSIAYRRA